MHEFVDLSLENALAQLAPAAGQRGRLQKYSRSGGVQTENPWRATGLFLARPDHNDLVCEALLLSAQNLCVLRVYWENPLNVVYAAKCSMISTVLSEAVSAATDAFSTQLDGIPNCSKNELAALSENLAVPEELWEALALATYPVPPPLRLDDIPDAEQPPAP